MRENERGCEQICVNSEGSFQCVCNIGFQLAEDGQTCLDSGEFLFWACEYIFGLVNIIYFHVTAILDCVPLSTHFLLSNTLFCSRFEQFSTGNICVCSISSSFEFHSSSSSTHHTSTTSPVCIISSANWTSIARGRIGIERRIPREHRTIRFVTKREISKWKCGWYMVVYLMLLGSSHPCHWLILEGNGR